VLHDLVVLRREHDTAGVLEKVERLHADMIASQEQRAGKTVVEGQREHAVEVPERVAAPTDQRVQNDLRVAARAELDLRSQSPLKLRVVVQLAVEHEAVTAAGRDHGLAGGGRRIEDHQPPKRQQTVAVAPDALLVRAASRHQPYQRSPLVGGRPTRATIEDELTANAAHARSRGDHI
jgi:hypothetical protein